MQEKRPISHPRSSRTFTRPPFICSKTSLAMFPLATFGAARTAASPSMGLFPRASRNTFSNRAYTGEIRILASGRPPRCRSRTRKKSRGHHRARPHGSERLHRLFCGLHGVQHAAGAGYLHRSRGAAIQESQPLARTSRGISLRRMGAARFRWFCRARFQRAGPSLLRSRAPLAHGAQARYSRPAGPSFFRAKYAGFALWARTLFRRGHFQPARERSLAAMTAERLPWITADPASLRLLELAEKVAVAPATLLITGESGTGKDHLARLVHELGPRRDASKANYSATSAVPLPARWSASSAVSSSAATAPSFSMRSPHSRPERRASSCAFCRSARLNASVARKPCASK